MTSLKFQIDGLDVEITHPEVKLTKPKLSSSLAQFVCPQCGRKTLSVEKGDVENAGKHMSAPDSKGVRKAVKGIFDAVKTGFEISKERREIEDEKSDFIGYVKKLSFWRRKNKGKFEYASNGGETSIPITCSICNTHYSLRVEITNPVKIEYEIDLVDVDFKAEKREDLIKIYQQRGIDSSDENLTLLESICASSLPYSEHAKDFLLRIKQLYDDREKVSEVIADLKISVGEAKFESESGQKWLNDLSSILGDGSKFLQRNLDEQLSACLQSIVEFAESPIPMEE